VLSSPEPARETRKIEDWISHARSYIGRAAKPSGQTAGGSDGPVAAIIAAPDFPVAPARLFGVPAADIYEIRTMAAIVPPSAGEEMDRSVGAALEFAVGVCRVRHIVVLAHPGCGLVRCLIDEDAPGANAVLRGRFLPSWTAIAASSLSRVLHAGIPESERAAICSQEMVRVSFENLMTYPWVLDAVYDGRLELHGLYADAEAGVFLRFDPESDGFVEP
jgi:carbonic anhydrase